MDKETTGSFADATRHCYTVLRAQSRHGRTSLSHHRRQAGGAASERRQRPEASTFALLCALSLALTLAAVSCQRQNQQLPPGVFGPGTHTYCLPEVKFVDQHGETS